MRDLSDYSLKTHNTFGIDARCRRFLEFETVKEAVETAAVVNSERMPYIIIGEGSNLLLTGDYEGIVIHSAIKGYEIAGNCMTCGSGMSWDDVVRISLDNGLYGAENLSIIPGDVGASAVQNIGAYGAEVESLVLTVEAVEIASGRVCVLSNADCNYGYRDSRFKQEWKNRYLITHVTYQFAPDFNPRLDYGNIRAELERRGISKPTAQQLRQTIIDIRREKLPDPEVTGNAGSFFKNPVVGREQFLRLAAQYPAMPHYHVDDEHEKIPAAWLIEQCGWKGMSLGRAGVHSRQPLVLVNLGGATGRDILNLCDLIQYDVFTKFDIVIFPEVNIV